jgi:hypothetical protein
MINQFLQGKHLNHNNYIVSNKNLHLHNKEHNYQKNINNKKIKIISPKYESVNEDYYADNTSLLLILVFGKKPELLLVIYSQWL